MQVRGSAWSLAASCCAFCVVDFDEAFVIFWQPLFPGESGVDQLVEIIKVGHQVVSVWNCGWMDAALDLTTCLCGRILLVFWLRLAVEHCTVGSMTLTKWCDVCDRCWGPQLVRRSSV